MAFDLNLFNDPQYLEPKCAKCGQTIKYGVTTIYRIKRKAHVCRNCGEVIR